MNDFLVGQFEKVSEQPLFYQRVHLSLPQRHNKNKSFEWDLAF